MTAIRRTPSRQLPTRLPVALGAALALVLTGCTGGTDGDDPAPGAAASPDTTPSAPPSPGPSTAAETDSAGQVVLAGDTALDPVGDAGTAAVQGGGFPAGGGPVAQLTDVRSAGHESFDRVVLEFDGEDMPSYRVGYVDPPIREDASGRPVEVAGEAFLQIIVTPASGVDLSGTQPEFTYEGPDRIEPPFADVVTEVADTGDFEAVLTWTVGLDERVPFGVATLADPLRLVVDLAHEPAPADTLEPVGEGTVEDSSAESSGAPVVLTDVRLGAHDGFDRIVFQTASGGRAGWEVGYVDDPRSQGSGEPLPVPGEAALGITLTGVALPPDAPEGVRPWDGPQEQSIAGAATLQALVEDTLFEGRYTFVAGLDERRPFAVARLADPERIVVDVLARQPEDGVELGAGCTNPAGFAVRHPAEWAVNDGDVVSPCSRFAPEEFDVPEASDARVAAVVVRVEPVPFDRVSEPRADELSRSTLTVDGRDAVRIERETVGGLYPTGTRITSYAVDLGEAPDGDGGRRTLVADTLDLGPFDYDRNVEVLDAMVGTLDLDAGQ